MKPFLSSCFPHLQFNNLAMGPNSPDLDINYRCVEMKMAVKAENNDLLLHVICRKYVQHSNLYLNMYIFLYIEIYILICICCTHFQMLVLNTADQAELQSIQGTHHKKTAVIIALYSSYILSHILVCALHTLQCRLFLLLFFPT